MKYTTLQKLIKSKSKSLVIKFWLNKIEYTIDNVVTVDREKTVNINLKKRIELINDL